MDRLSFISCYYDCSLGLAWIRENEARESMRKPFTVHDQTGSCSSIPTWRAVTTEELAIRRRNTGLQRQTVIQVSQIWENRVEWTNAVGWT